MNAGITGRRYGPDAWLLAFGSHADLAVFTRGEALRHALESRPPRGLAELVPSFATLLCRFEPGTAPENDGWWAASGPRGVARETGPGRVVRIPVRYDGEDLDAVARHHGMTVAEVVRRHAAPEYHVHCLGFAPGFPYLGGLDAALHTPRRAVPRARVPAGSVAIGGSHAGVYSIASPGGWNLLGTTPRRLFDPRAAGEDAFLLRPGDAVRFEETRDTAVAGPDPEVAGAGGSAGFTVLSAGMGITVQDRGRPGWARFGVPAGGAMDPVALEWANRLVDNPPGSAALELAMGRQEFRAETEIAVGLAGADLGATVLRAGDSVAEPMETGRTIALRAGDRLKFSGGRRGVWAYLAVPGGVDGMMSMGSRATSPRAGIGTVVSTGGRVTRVGDGLFRPGPGTGVRRVPWDGAKPGAEIHVRVWPGPQADAFGDAALGRWFGTGWRVSAQIDRVGYRLDGGNVAPPAGEMISEPVLPGTIQIPPGGEPIVTMMDGPTMGGYAKLAVIDPADLARMAQASPGTVVRFVPRGDAGWGTTWESAVG